MTENGDANFYRDLKKRYPIIERASGIYLYDDQGKEYIDFESGVEVANIGYSVAEVTREMVRQLEKTTFVYSGYFTNEPRIRLSQKLVQFCPQDLSRVIFAGSGSEANEIAIKIARQYHRETGEEGRYKVISRRLSYHGNTIGSLSVSGRPSWRDHFQPYMHQFPQISPPYCYRCPLGLEHPACDVRCARELEDVIQAEGPETISAFIAEPIIGTTVAGVTPQPEYYGIIRAICDKYNVLFIADEVITGLGRTGKNLGIDHWQVTPDIVTLAKGLGAGYVPLSAAIVHNKIFDAIAGGSGRHTQGFTYSGNPLSCAAGLAVLEYVEANGLVEAAKEKGEYLRGRLEALREIDIVGDIRGKGLYFGIEFVADRETREPFPAEARLTERIVTRAFEMGLFLIEGMPGCAGGALGDQIQVCPALVITEPEIDRAAELLQVAIRRSMEDIGR